MHVLIFRYSLSFSLSNGGQLLFREKIIAIIFDDKPYRSKVRLRPIGCFVQPERLPV